MRPRKQCTLTVAQKALLALSRAVPNNKDNNEIKITNLSTNFKLTKEEEVILKLGPTTRITPTELTKEQVKKACDRLIRRVKIIDKFDNKPETRMETRDNTPYIANHPNPSYEPEFENIAYETDLNSLKNDILEEYEKYSKRTKPQAESIRAAQLNATIKNLKQRLEENMVNITISDKGKGFVIVDNHWKDTVALNRLQNATAYTQQAQEPNHQQTLTTIIAQGQNLPKEHQQHLTHTLQFNKELDCLTPTDLETSFKTPTLNPLPKTQKITEANRHEPCPARPVVNAHLTPTRGASNLLSLTLTPTLKNVKTICTDSRQAINDIETNPELAPGMNVVVVDIKDMYGSLATSVYVPHLRPHITQHLPNIDVPHQQALTNLLSTCLTNSTVSYTDAAGTTTYYSQNNNGGCPQGLSCSPVYANIALIGHDNALLNKYKYIIKAYKRYQDDIRFVVPGFYKEADVMKIIKYFNSIDPNIQIDMSSIQITNITAPTAKFLDTEIYTTKDGTGFAVKPYSKPTATHQYINNTSHHPVNTKAAVINTVHRQAITNSTNVDDYNKRKEFIFNRFTNLGYHKHFINNALQKSNYNNRQEYLTIKTKSTLPQRSTILPFVIDYRSAPFLKTIERVTHNFINLIQQRYDFPVDKRLVFSYRKTRTLLQQLRY